MGVIPNNTGGFGDVVEAAQVFVRNELTPLQERIKEVNEWIGAEVIRFKPYELTPAEYLPIAAADIAAFLHPRLTPSDALHGTYTANHTQAKRHTLKRHHDVLRRKLNKINTTPARNAIPATPARFMGRF